MVVGEIVNIFKLSYNMKMGYKFLLMVFLLYCVVLLYVFVVVVKDIIIFINFLLLFFFFLVNINFEIFFKLMEVILKLYYIMRVYLN